MRAIHRPGLRRRLAWLALAALACGGEERAAAPSAPQAASAAPPVEKAAYVGSAACAECHAAESARWRDSDHALAMQKASAASVRGNFDDVALQHFGVSSRFVRNGERFAVETEGASHDVAYTLGVDPLQQLLVEGPRGRLQALDTAWDTRPKERGGARWFHLQRDAIPPHDVLHWSRPSHTWNAMCADCHVTDYAKGYIAAEDRYASRWSELGVGCESCHGPGSQHVRWAPDPARAANAKNMGLTVALGPEHAFRFAEGAAIAHREPASSDGAEIDVCAACHARRGAIADGWQAGQPFLDYYRPALLDADLYHADGQIDDEVYEWGSFVQSRMFAAGVTCSDCHDPHSLHVDADAVCAQCHRAEVFATPAHHHHEEGSEGARCVSCHMPQRTYMQIDARRDHSFRVPRPDLAASLGTPDACAACHSARGAKWSAETVARWRGDKPVRAHFAAVLDAARRGEPDAGALLAALAVDTSQPAIARATALRELASRPDRAAVPSIQAGLQDPEPLVRMAALEALEPAPPEARQQLAAPLLRDPVRVVRLEAVRQLAPLPPDAHAALGADWTRALAEYRAALARDADRPESRVGAGLLALQLGDLAAAQREYEAALRIEPYYRPASVNLADLHRMAGHDDEGVKVLAEALQRDPEGAELHHAMGLALVRAGRHQEALAHFERAAKSAPEQARFAYVYAVALHGTGNAKQAMDVIQAALALHPNDASLRQALVDFGPHADAQSR
ncbi:MAG TPA: tetratricopeptide repeat protein [Myxococcota bacterium]|nr:tetratricopeptide repeat protein [Myxococcota bacterium]